jgi:TRAP-type mannitol/chloroaromatic compound transport system permease large subunit
VFRGDVVPHHCDRGRTDPAIRIRSVCFEAAPDVPLQIIYRASWPFVWIIVAGLVLFAVFPDLITFLPNLTSSR